MPDQEIIRSVEEWIGEIDRREVILDMTETQKEGLSELISIYRREEGDSQLTTAILIYEIKMRQQWHNEVKQ